MLNRVSPDVWVGADRVKTTGDLLQQLPQIVDRYGPDKPVYFSVGRGVVGRKLAAIGECWRPENRLSAPADGDGVSFIIQAKGLTPWLEQPEDA